MTDTIKPTPEQQDCVDSFTSRGKLRINAYAGTGKTATLGMIARSTRRTGLYGAFNKSIADDARAKFPDTVKCQTMHSLAFRAVARDYDMDAKTKNFNGGFLAYKLKLKNFVIDEHLTLRPRSVGVLVSETLRRFMQSKDAEIMRRHVPLLGALESVKGLADQEKDDGVYSMALTAIVDRVYKHAVDAWENMIDPRGDLPFSHDGYVKIFALSQPQFDCDYFLLDEAQDTNAVIIGLVENQQCQVITVGDRHQSIYEWRGALNAMDILPCDFEARLSKSWRFGEAIAANANAVLELLGETVPLVGNSDKPGKVGRVGNARTILCHTNARAIEETLQAIESGRTPHIIGGTKETERVLQAVQSLKAGKAVDYPLEFFGFSEWRDVEQAVEMDGGDELKRWVTLVQRNDVDFLLDMLTRKTAPSEKSADVIISTGHKAKGREWDTVRVCEDFFRGVSPDTNTDANCSNEELRLAYVALTRGMVGVEMEPGFQQKLARLQGKFLREVA